jgi:competence transcription factor ComK
MGTTNQRQISKYIYLWTQITKKLKMRVEKKGERLLYNILTNH